MMNSNFGSGRGNNSRWGDPRIRNNNHYSNDPRIANATTTAATTSTSIPVQYDNATNHPNTIATNGSSNNGRIKQDSNYCQPTATNSSSNYNNGMTTTTTTTNNAPMTIESESNNNRRKDDVNDPYNPNNPNNLDMSLEAVCKREDFMLIDQTEWADDGENGKNKNNGENGRDNPTFPELAKRPKPDFVSDPCQCDMPEEDEVEFGEEPPANPLKSNRPMACTDMSCILFSCQEECRSNCNAREFCGNKRIQRKQWKKLQVIPAGKKGMGLIVLEDCKKGDFLTEYVGQAVPKSFLQKLFRKYRHERKIYIMELDGGILLDARRKGGVARFINHSCEPNCVVEQWKVRGIIRAGIFAKKAIKAGTELSFDYQWERRRGRAVTKCYCHSVTCRGTLEVAKSLEDEELQRKLCAHWKKPLIQRAGAEIINRSIQVFSKETQEYYSGDVIQYDEQSGQHLIIYRHDLEEVWEDLKSQDWMILDEEGEQLFVIGKKKKPKESSPTQHKRSLLVGATFGTGIKSHLSSHTSNNSSPQSHNNNSNRPSTLFAGAIANTRNFIYVQTPIKERFYNNHLIERCQRNCRVKITSQQFAKPPLPCDTTSIDDVEKYKALEKSDDGTVWRLTIAGSDIAQAFSILQKNSNYFEKKRFLEKQQQFVKQEMNKNTNGSNDQGGGSGSGNTGDPSLLSSSGGLGGGTSTGGDGNTTGTISGGAAPTDVILPRCIVDMVKKRLPLLREVCRSINITFVASESKSKQFARLVLEGSLLSDLNHAKEQLWMQLVAACLEVKAPLSPAGIPLDLGFFGGELSATQFQQLLDYNNTSTPSSSSLSSLSLSSSSNTGGTRTTATATTGNNSASNTTSTQDAKEDLTRRSPFFKSFEATQRCNIWVQSDFDKGRIVHNRIVSEATPNTPRKIYFGCDPKEVPKLWSLVQTRANEVSRGVKYLYLGPDRLYQPYMMQKGGQFFDYLQKVSGASVTVDSMTGDHLRIDGRIKDNTAAGTSTTTAMDLTTSTPTTDSMTDKERAALAEELIRLQIELYRDHFIREQSWIFGRDWTLVRQTASQNAQSPIDPSPSSTTGSSTSPMMMTTNKSTSSSTSRFLLFDSKSVSNVCLEMSEIVSALSLGGSVAAHAVVILYRFVSLLSTTVPQQQFKVREVALACIFLANKAQKSTKWKPLRKILEAAYSTFYPGAQFDENKEEVIVLEDKVISAETYILTLLDYDVFWRGFDWIMTAGIEEGGMKRSSALNALKFSVSGPVLAAGPDLWLKYGAEYVFAAAAGFLEAKLDLLCPSLSLIPLKVSQAAEAIVNSVTVSLHSSKKHSSHPLLQDGKKALLDKLPRIKEACVKLMSQGIIGSSSSSSSAKKINVVSESEQRYKIIGDLNRKRNVFIGVNAAVVKGCIIPAMDGISAESKCSVFVEENSERGSADIVLEGSWRALSIAVYLLEETVRKAKDVNELLPKPLYVTADTTSQSKIQAKGRPGLLEMKDIETNDAWVGTIQSQESNQSIWGRKTGGKCCLAGKVTETTLRGVGMRWWIPPRYGPSPTGSICDMFLVNNSTDGSDQFESLSKLTHAFVGNSAGYSILTSSTLTTKKKDGGSTNNNNDINDRFVAVSIQRWPSEKVANREQERGKQAKGAGLQMGFSAAAMQEMQLLNQLHKLIPSPQGHPNFILPVAVAIPPEVENNSDNKLSPNVFGGGVTTSLDFSRSEDDIFSLNRTSEENELAAEKERKRRKELVTGPHLVFQPTPFILQRIISRNKRDGDDQYTSPAIVAAWFHDLLSSLVHCHTNNVLLRTIQTDQIVVDHSGVAKLGGLYRATVVSPDEPDYNLVKLAKSRARKEKVSDDDINQLAAPEMLLGSPKHTKESDVWAMGCLLGNLLLSKPVFIGKQRQQLLSAIYKIVGVPSNDNYPEAVHFPYYKEPSKKYKPGVVKAFKYMMKDECNKHSGAIDLLGKMLTFDPSKRITAVDALRHDYMANYIENCNLTSFRQQFVKDWMTLKKRLVKSCKTEEDEIKARERGIKRKQMLMAVSSSKSMNDDDDDLYDMDDILGGGDIAKKLKR